MRFFSLALRRYAVFSGRAQRAEFWYFVLYAVLIELVLFGVDKSMGWVDSSGEYGFLSMSVAGVLLLVPSISVATRRLHDIGKSGWWQLITLIPVLGILVLMYWCALDGQEGSNAYGDNPKAAHQGLLKATL